MKKIVDLYIFSNFHVALSVTALANISVYNLNGVLNLPNLLLVFFTTFFAYHFISFFERFYQQSNSLIHFILKYPKLNVWFILIGFLGSLYLIQYIDFKQFIILIPVGVLTFLYAVPVLNFKNNQITIRQFPRLKIFVIALVWTFVTVLFIKGGISKSWNLWVEFFQRFIFIVAITIPFDIRDFYRDDLHIKTIPQEMGLENAKKVGILLMVVFFTLIFFKNPLTASQVLSELIVFCVSIVLIYFSDNNRSLYYTAFWIESIPILWLLLLIFTRSIVN